MEMDKDALVKVIAKRLSAGVPVEQVAARFKTQVGSIDGRPAVILPGWTAVADDGDDVYYPDAASPAEAAERYVDIDSVYAPADRTYWVHVHCYRLAVGLDQYGYPVVRVPDGIDMDTRVTIPIHPEEPECSSKDGGVFHEWQAVAEWGHGAGLVIDEVCTYCGLRRTRDTWAQDPETGIQGLESIEYLTPGRG